MNRIKKLLLNQGKWETVTGVPPLTLSKSLGKPLKDYKIYGNSIQDGTPTPSNPVEIESVGDKTINLFSGENVTTDKVLAWLTGRESSSSSAANDIITPYLLIDELSYLNSNYNFAVFFYDDNENYLGNSEDVRQTAGIYYGSNRGAVSISSAISSNPNIKYYRVWYRSSVNNNIDFKEITDIMLYDSNTLIDNYEPYGYTIPISVSSAANKNLIYLKDLNNFASTNMRNSCSNQIFERVCIGAVSTSYLIQSQPFTEEVFVEPLQMGKTYIWKIHNGTLKSSGFYMTLGMENGTTQNWYENTPITLTQNATVTGIRQKAYTYAKDDVESFQIQIEEGTVATEYEPYRDAITTNIYLDEPLRKVGDVTDYIDFESGKVVRNINQIILDENSDWGSYKSGKYTGFKANDILPDKSYSRATGISNQSHYVGVYYNAQHLNAIWVGVSNKNIYWIYQDDYDDTLADSGLSNLKARLAVTPLVIDYILNTPVEESIALPSVLTAKGTHVISIKTEIQPSNMSVIYKRR